MAIRSATSVKATFETGDKPTESHFGDFVDSSMRDPLIAIATAAEGGGTGVVEIVSTASATLRSLGAFGVIILDAATTTSAQGHLGAGTVGTLLLEAVTTASALGHIDGQADLDVPSQAEAEAGTATDERVWTAQRVKQAIEALNVTAASQVEQETGTEATKYVAPATQQYHQSAGKLWAYVNRTGGTPSLSSPSYNVTSVADGAAGVTTVTIATDFSSVIYAVGGSAAAGDVNATTIVPHNIVDGAFDIAVRDQNNGAVDTKNFTCWAFGDQA